MRDFGNKSFPLVYNSIVGAEDSSIETKINNEDFTLLKYFLINKDYYSEIIDDYPFEIVNKESLLEALYFQARLITMHNLNWDAFEEALNDALNNFLGFEGICLMFRKGNDIKYSLPNEFKMLTEIVGEINKQEGKRIKIILNQ